MKKRFLLVGIIIVMSLLLGVVVFNKPSSREDKKYLSKEETNSMLSYTLDGEKTDVKPTKESGYLANKISCKNRSNLIWDNTNWEVEIIKLESSDVCNIDFTKDSSSNGYRISATTNVNSGIDSLSKATIENGKVIFYPSEGYEIAGVSGCANGKLEEGKVVVSNITSNQTCNITVEELKKTLYATLTDGISYLTVNTRSNFDAVFGSSSATTKTIYRENTYRETSGNNKKNVYYFAGNVADNWVEFAGKMWRIIRTNEDGGVRLLYHGTSTTATDAYIVTRQAYNPTYDNTMYVGYMYGSTGSIGNNRTNGTSSRVKTVVDNWYRDNINSSYGNYVSQTAIYCNDRASGEYASSGTMWYAAVNRLYHNNTTGRHPSYQCGQNSAGGYHNTSSNWVSSTAAYTSAAPNVADKFSKSTASGGNGKLTYPVGLMTADEVAFAGGLYGTSSPNTYYYLNSVGGSSTGASYWWTMSPYYFGVGYAIVFAVYGSSDPGRLSVDSVHGTYAVRPVLSLKSCVVVSSGNGTAESPYKVEIDSICSSSEN